MSSMFTLAQALRWIPGGKLVGEGATEVLRVHSDTRTLQAGDLFIALKGERFDATDFLTDAMAKGAVAEAGGDDIVLLAGKGHEQGQIIGEMVLPFDDVSVARECAA